MIKTEGLFRRLVKLLELSMEIVSKKQDVVLVTNKAEPQSNKNE